MLDLVNDAIKGISLTLFFLFFGIVTEFHWFFWLFLLFFFLRPQIDKLTHYLNNLKNHPPQ